MSRRARIRAQAKPWTSQRPEQDTSSLEQALAAVAADRQRREQPPSPPRQERQP